MFSKALASRPTISSRVGSGVSRRIAPTATAQLRSITVSRAAAARPGEKSATSAPTADRDAATQNACRKWPTNTWDELKTPQAEKKLAARATPNTPPTSRIAELVPEAIPMSSGPTALTTELATVGNTTSSNSARSRPRPHSVSWSRTRAATSTARIGALSRISLAPIAGFRTGPTRRRTTSRPAPECHTRG